MIDNLLLPMLLYWTTLVFSFFETWLGFFIAYAIILDYLCICIIRIWELTEL